MNSKAKNWQGMGRVQKNFCSAAENSIKTFANSIDY
jgi:hypothetical protein